ncbi:MAG: ABC transporter permease [Rhizobiales bacterium]|nr:ABC transporter permease [Hyphomicrobiales bacterium]
MDFSWLPKYLPLLFSGLSITLQLLLITMVLGFLLAVPLGLVQVTGPRWLASLARGYCTIMRGTPLLIQLYLFYYGLGSIFQGFPELRQSFLWPVLREGYYYVVVAFVLNEAGYAGEIFRGGFLSVPKGELEAARAYGMSPWKVLSRVWLPRAVRNVMPALGVETIQILKSTPAAALVTVVDLFGVADRVRQETYIIYPPLIVLMIVYLVLVFIITRIFSRIEAQVPSKR